MPRPRCPRACRPLLAVLALPAVALAADFPSGVAAGDAQTLSTGQAQAVLWTQVLPPQATTLVVQADGELPLTLDLPAGGLPDGVIFQDVGGLQPGATYRYQFIAADGSASPTGQFRTPPAAGTGLVPLRFAISGDSSAVYQPFRVLEPLIQDPPDFFLYNGDVIYSDYPAGVEPARTPEQYRADYAENRADPYLQGLLAVTSVWASWDDHELYNDYAGDAVTDAARQQGAYDAFFEWMAVRRSPAEPNRLYRSFRWADTAEFFILDGRQYRDEPTENAAAQRDPGRSMLGEAQFAWLLDGLAASTARYKFIVNNVPMLTLGIRAEDRWDGYDAERRALLEAISARGIQNVVVLTCDTHANIFVPDLGDRLRGQGYAMDPANPVPEFVVGPIGVSTLRQGAIQFAPGLIGLSASPFTDLVFGQVFTALMPVLASWNDAAFLSPNRFAYLEVQVDAAGQATFTYWGTSADAAATDPVTVLFTTGLPPTVTRPVIQPKPAPRRPPSGLLGIFQLLFRHGLSGKAVG